MLPACLLWIIFLNPLQITYHRWILDGKMGLPPWSPSSACVHHHCNWGRHCHRPDKVWLALQCIVDLPIVHRFSVLWSHNSLQPSRIWFYAHTLLLCLTRTTSNCKFEQEDDIQLTHLLRSPLFWQIKSLFTMTKEHLRGTMKKTIMSLLIAGGVMFSLLSLISLEVGPSLIIISWSVDPVLLCESYSQFQVSSCRWSWCLKCGYCKHLSMSSFFSAIPL